MYFSIVCSEGEARIDDRSVAALTNGRFVGDGTQGKAACANWPRYDNSPDFYKPLRDSPAIPVHGSQIGGQVAARTDSQSVPGP